MSEARRAWQELCWLLLSPPLLAPAAAQGTPARIQQFTAGERSAIEAWLAALAQDPAPLLAHLRAALPASGAPLRLGRRAERLLEFFLRHGPTHRLVAANVALRQPTLAGGDHTTRGEIDFLLEDAAGRPWHWELAVKFFLCTARGATAVADDFIGPDRIERFSAKLHKLFTRQLAHRAPPPYEARAWQPAAYTRGFMFYRYGARAPQCELLDARHGHGWWIARDEAETLPRCAFVLVERSQWMGGLPGGPVLDLAGLLAAIDRRWAGAAPRGARRWPGAQMVALVGAGEHGSSRVMERGFVVPQGWEDSP